MAAPLVVMLAKSPVPGRVKTRLTAGGTVTAAEAAALSAACVRDLSARWLRPERWQLMVVHPADDSGRELAALVPAGVEVVPEPSQAAGSRDFGAVLGGIFAAWCGDGARPVLVVGSDVPLLSPARLEEACAALGQAELVLGPDRGGGCYLIGCRRALDLFGPGSPEGPVAWSVGTDFAELAARAERRELRWVRLAEEDDLDEPADLERLRLALAGSDPGWLPTVRAVLAGMGPRGP